ncbi:MAG: 16S rRNA (uracil(1498)-N(3))-methyltransferase [Actinobacteria bacterium]|nr:16S rRNA (uracil(1498)-N(3))-methyltransferase [Actinomycetota bacterium]
MSGEHASRRPVRFFIASPLERKNRAVHEGSSSAPPAAGSLACLDAEDSHHAVRVLRLRVGDGCEIVQSDAPGRVWAATIETMGPPVGVRLTRLMEESSGAVLRLALVQGLLVLSKVDEIIDKGTQVGIDEFLMVQAEQSPVGAERKAAARVERWERVARAAAKQSRQPALPRITVVSSVTEAAQTLNGDGFLSLVLDPGAERTLSGLLKEHEGTTLCGKRLALFVGPEGGWTEAERACLLNQGVEVVRLGRRILRAETAGIVAAAVVRSVCGDW